MHLIISLCEIMRKSVYSSFNIYMKKLIPLYALVFSFGMGFGYLKNDSWNIRDWGFYSSKYVAIWWIVMGFIVTIYCIGERLLKDRKG